MLHVFYRSCSRENNKLRPSFYSKAVCLESCLLALKAIPDAKFVLINDGVVGADLRALAEPMGNIIELDHVGEAESFIFTMREATKRATEDIVYFAEDDYLHCPDAFVNLIDCLAEVDCDYATLFDDPLRYKLSDDVPPDLPLPKEGLYVTRGRHWRTIESTTLTFGCAAGTIGDDLEVFSHHVLRRAADKSYIADRESWRELQGLGNYKREGHRRKLVGAIPSLATHCETTALSPTVDWRQLGICIATDLPTSRLAIDGGQPAKMTYPLPMMPGALELGEPEKRAVEAVVHSQRVGRYTNPWATKSYVDVLEGVFAARTGAPYCLAVSSGTAALHCALVALGIGVGDEVIVPAYTWMSSATTICQAGAVPIIADIDETLNLDPQSVEACITSHTRALMVVHMRGAQARMDALQEIALRHNLLIIEDTAQAMGATFRSRHLGTFGDIGCFSLQAYKILTTGEGGLMLFKDVHAYQRARSFHGTPPHMLEEQYHTLSLNYAMSELTGAVGIAQLERLDGMLDRMRRAKAQVCAALTEIAQHKPVQLREIVDPYGDAAVSATIFVETPQKADRISAALAAENIGNYRLYRPDHPDYHLYLYWTAIMNQRSHSLRGGPWEAAEQRVRYTHEMCPRAVDLLSRSIDINIYPQFTDRELQETIVGLRKVLNALA